MRIWIQPRAADNALTGVYGDHLKIRVTAPPLDGRANKALCKFLSAALAVRPNRVSVISGAESRRKLVCVSGVSVEWAKARLVKLIQD